jgi:hypothetical protein
LAERTQDTGADCRPLFFFILYRNSVICQVEISGVKTAQRETRKQLKIQNKDTLQKT